jgi:hypothetical protein
MIQLKDAWLILGEDPKEIYTKIASQPSISSKIETVSNLFIYAKTISKKLLAQNHPDRNPNDAEAEKRFKRVQEALAAIEFHTDEFRVKATQKMSDEETEEGCYIRFE